MISLLFHTCGLMLIHLRHCIVYALPTLLLFAVTLYLFQSDQFPVFYTFIGVLLFFIANTLFVHAVARQMLRVPAGAINILNPLIWRKAHNDFFIFITLGIIVLVVLLVYCFDAVDYLTESADAWRRQQQEAQLQDGTSFAAGSYTVLALGSRALSFVFLGITLWGWMYVCRVGVRIPAYVEGYYLRTHEAFGLVRRMQWGMLALSLLFVMASTSLVKIITGHFAAFPLWGTIAAWTTGYFLLIVMHLAMWTDVYVTAVKLTGYPMSRQVH